MAQEHSYNIKVENNLKHSKRTLNVSKYSPDNEKPVKNARIPYSQTKSERVRKFSLRKQNGKKDRLEISLADQDGELKKCTLQFPLLHSDFIRDERTETEFDKNVNGKRTMVLQPGVPTWKIEVSRPNKINKPTEENVTVGPDDPG